MDRESIAAFSLKSAKQRAECFGTKVRFRDCEHVWPLAAPSPDAELSEGGFHEKIEIVARVPGSVTPPPALGESVEILATGRVLRVLNVCPADANNPLSAEHLVDLVAA